MSELAYTISVRRQTARLKVERGQGQPSTPSGSAQTVQVFEGGKRTKICSYSKDHYLSLPSVPTHVTRRQEKALIALRPEATRALERLEE